MLCCYFEQIKRKAKPCRVLGGFSGEAGETTIAIGDEAATSDSPVGKDSPLRNAKKTHKLLRHFYHGREEVVSDWPCVFIGERLQQLEKH